MGRPEPDPARIAAAQRAAADKLLRRAQDDPIVADVLVGALERLSLWRICAKRQCRNARACQGDAVSCAARYWPAACAVMAEIAAAKKRGTAPRLEQLLRWWKDENGLLRRTVVTLVCWGFERHKIAGEL